MSEKDHDILIGIASDMKHVKETLDGLPCEKHAKRMSTMVTKSWFKWIIGFVIIGLIGLASLGTANKMSLTEINVKQETVIEKLNKMNGE